MGSDLWRVTSARENAKGDETRTTGLSDANSAIRSEAFASFPSTVVRSQGYKN